MQMVTAATNYKILASWKNSCDKPRQCIKKQRRHNFADKGLYSQSYGLSSSHTWCESWAMKKAEHQRIDAFELWCWRRLLRVPLDCKEIKRAHPKGNESWIFIGRTDAQTETPILWSPDVKSWLIRKDPDAEKDWGKEENEVTEDETVRWHIWLNGYEFEQTLGDNEGQGRPDVLQVMGLQRVGHDLVTEQQQRWTLRS